MKYEDGTIATNVPRRFVSAYFKNTDSNVIAGLDGRYPVEFLTNITLKSIAINTIFLTNFDVDSLATMNNVKLADIGINKEKTNVIMKWVDEYIGVARARHQSREVQQDRVTSDMTVYVIIAWAEERYGPSKVDAVTSCGQGDDGTMIWAILGDDGNATKN